MWFEFCGAEVLCPRSRWDKALLSRSRCCTSVMPLPFLLIKMTWF